MAQYYQIVGQGASLTIEDLQRYCPNLCLDGIIVNQEDQQYAQQQVNYIIYIYFCIMYDLGNYYNLIVLVFR